MLDHLAADRARVAELEAQILQLQDRIRDLEGEKHLTQHRLDRYCYPVLTLPNEITSEIFTHFLPAFPLRPPLIGIASPTVLTQICRAWREIAFSTPTLWRAMTIPSSPIIMTFEAKTTMADRWLGRSRSCPLSIEIGYRWYGTSVSPLLSRIFAEVARLQELKLVFSAPELGAFAACLPATSFPIPLLRRLELFMFDPDPSLPSTVFRDTPQLRTVVLDDIAAFHFQLPWSQLTSVTLHRVYPRECVPVLRQTHNLLHCNLSLCDEDTDNTTEPLTLPYLQSLTLQRDSEEPYVGYLDSLTLPVLHTLSIPEPFLGEGPVDALTRFFNKSGCKLHELSITDKILRDLSIYRQGFPLIPRLTLCGWRSTEESHERPIESINEISDLFSESTDG
ncbi:hypothetical protein C8R46DRAFT_80729 [Mycena filopes]|nr:hypothetical protein C8R46DRAFT_80729 [Mycena filopes]